jgi:hypothetical protein
MAPWSRHPRRAAFTFVSILLGVSISYTTVAGRFLLTNSKGYPDDPAQHSESKPFELSSRPASRDAVYHNATEALERILDFFPLDKARAKEASTRKEGQTQNQQRKESSGNDRHDDKASATNMEEARGLSRLIDESTWTVKAPVENQLDFAIIGHAKTGTTFLQSTWFSAHPEIHMPKKECRLMPQEGGAAKVVKELYKLREDGAELGIYGYKNPQDISRPRALANLREHFSKTRLIIGLRHPIWWFQSFYNYRLKRGGDLPPPEALVGACRPECPDVCTDAANFHANLATLGLTNRSSSREMDFLSTKAQLRRAMRPALSNSIFLFEQTQLDAVRDARVAEALRLDLSSFLGLRTPLSPLTRAYQSPTDARFSICEPRYADLRQELVRVGKAASSWILDFFLDQPTVTVSSRTEFARLLEAWGEDPCSLLPAHAS